MILSDKRYLAQIGPRIVRGSFQEVRFGDVMLEAEVCSEMAM